MEGLLIIDKPSGLTSHDVCQRIKHALRCRRVGHTGTLDPLATGVLPVLLNGATKWAPQFAEDEKEYYVTAIFGVTTTTYDTEGTVVAGHPVPADWMAQIEAALPHLRGAIQQVPPPFSAVKFQGKPLYWWARRGKTVSIPSRPVNIRLIEVCDPLPCVVGRWSLHTAGGHALVASKGSYHSPSTIHHSLPLRIICSKGTYVRSLIHDLGQLIGCGAHVSALRRTRSGRFTVDDAHPLEAVCGATDALHRFDKFLYKKTGHVVSP